MGKTIASPIRSKHLGFCTIRGVFCQPFGENTFSKNAPKTNNVDFAEIGIVPWTLYAVRIAMRNKIDAVTYFAYF